MIDQTNAELIEEARLAECSECSEEGTNPAMRCDGDLIRRLADALEASEKRWERRVRIAEQERDQYAAVVEKVEDFVTRHYLDTTFGDEVLPILATAPADVLREHDAAIIEELADEVHATLSDPNRKRPRDPRGEFATDLLNDVAWAVHLIREKARQRREEQDHG